MTLAELFKSLSMKNIFTYSKENKQIEVLAYLNKENVFQVVNVTKNTHKNITADRTVSIVENYVK